MRNAGVSRLKELVKPAKQTRFDAQMAGEVEALRREVAGVAQGTDPVLVGPFTSEVGFELLYWIPLLRWAVREFPELRGRLVVISRGGVHHWVDGLEARYVDVFSLFEPDEVMRRRLRLKQRELNEFEMDILERAKAQLGIGPATLLHPAVLFNLYYRVLKIERHAFARSVQRVDGSVEGLGSLFEPMPPPPRGHLDGVLPEEYVAVRFYFRPSFPDTPENERFALRAIAAIAERCPVVLLNNGLELDDHGDFAGLPNDRVVRIDHLMRPETNLDVQTIALAHSSAFVGTYGGLAYLAPFLGVSSLSFSSQPEHTHLWHLDLATRVFAGPGWGSMVSIRPADLPLLDLVAHGFGKAVTPGAITRTSHAR